MVITSRVLVFNAQQLLSFFLKDDKPEEVVERVAEKNTLDAAMRAALEVRIQKEIERRCDNR